MNKPSNYPPGVTGNEEAINPSDYPELEKFCDWLYTDTRANEHTFEELKIMFGYAMAYIIPPEKHNEQASETNREPKQAGTHDLSFKGKIKEMVRRTTEKHGKV